MRGKYQTIYATSFAIVKAVLKDELTFEEAEVLGKDYCDLMGYDYINTEKVEA